MQSSAWGLLAPLLLVLFVGLKLAGIITWSWFWVLSPAWIGLVFFVAVFLIAIITLALAKTVRR
jgi:hypothetical protein